MNNYMNEREKEFLREEIERLKEENYRLKARLKKANKINDDCSSWDFKPYSPGDILEQMHYFYK